jgi:hypothetical protein
MTQVTSKERLNGYILGVQFVNGKAETESPTAIAFFKQSEGYEVHDSKAKAKPAGADAAGDK